MIRHRHKLVTSVPASGESVLLLNIRVIDTAKAVKREEDKLRFAADIFRRNRAVAVIKHMRQGIRRFGAVITHHEIGIFRDLDRPEIWAATGLRACALIDRILWRGLDNDWSIGFPSTITAASPS